MDFASEVSKIEARLSKLKEQITEPGSIEFHARKIWEATSLKEIRKEEKILWDHIDRKKKLLGEIEILERMIGEAKVDD